MLTFLPWRRPEIAIDFGTANLRVIDRQDGIVFDEPSLCCFANADTAPSLFAAGREAAAMVDRTTGNLAIKRPLHRGVMQDISAATHILRYAVPRALGRKRMVQANVVFGVPADATQAERQALHMAAHDAGLGRVRLIQEPLAAAIGAQLPVFSSSGSMIVECGAGTTEVAVLADGQIHLTRSFRAGGIALNTAIREYLHFQHQFLIGERTAETLKQQYYAQHSEASHPNGHHQTVSVKGRSLTSQSPGSLDIQLCDLNAVVRKHGQAIAHMVHKTLLQTPDALAADIRRDGIVLTGGAAYTPMLREMIAQETGAHTIIGRNPQCCVARGLQYMLRR